MSGLLKEIDGLKVRETAVYTYLRKAIDSYWVTSEVHLVEKKLYNLQERPECKKFWTRLLELKGLVN